MNNSTPLPDQHSQQVEQVKKPGGSKMVGILLGVLVVIALAVGAYVMSRVYQNSNEPASSQTTQPSVSPTPDEEKEAQAVDTGDVEQDLQSVQKDVDAL